MERQLSCRNGERAFLVQMQKKSTIIATGLSAERDAERICKRYRDENRQSRGGNRFNILAANVNTMKPALYNSTPIPDIRRRNQGKLDPISRDAAAVMESAVSLSLEDGRFDDAIKSSVMDMLQGGRGVVRVRNKPLIAGGEAVWYSVCAERVPWKDFRHQPEADWALVNWIAFRHYLDRDQLEELNPAVGSRVRLDHSVAPGEGSGYGTSKGPTDVFKRAEVWEIWDKRTRRCLFIASSWKRGPLKIEDDPLRLEAFFPVAPPLWADKDPDSMVPLPDFRLYEDLASELDEITRRIQALIRVCKWRGLYNAAMGVLAQLEDADDGQLKPVDMIDPTVSIENYIWLMPVDRIVQVLQQMYEQRTQILSTIYEITGLSDIIRGNTDPNETLGSQRIKAQWASGKLSIRQGDVQRLCRDLIRMKAEIIVEHWPPEVLSAMTGIMVTPQIQQLLTSDQLRMWRIDVETDSTIQADLTDARENIGQLIEGIGKFVQSFAPAVQGGLVSAGEAIKLLAAFSKPFRLGRSAEQVFDEMVAKAEQHEQQPQQGPPPDPALVEAQGKMQIAQQQLQMDGQHKAAQLQLEHWHKDQQLQLEHKKAGLDEMGIGARQAGAQADMQIAQAKVPYELQQMEMDLAEKRAAAFAAERQRQDAMDKSRLEREAFIATKQAEIAKAQNAARAAAELADIKKQIEIEAAQSEAAAAANARQAAEQQRQMEMDAFALKSQVEIAQQQAALAIAQAEARRADEMAHAKNQLELQAMADRQAAVSREEMAVAEDARRRREIDEKAYLRTKEAEIGDIEAKAAASKTQAFSASNELMAKQAMMAAEMEKIRTEHQMMLEKASSDAKAPQQAELLARVLQQQAEMLQTLVAVVAAPKRVIRDAEGAIVGTQTAISPLAIEGSQPNTSE